ncbi:hypothetical protein SAMD00019534_019950, partial [Acytostelium subglobosum LB1]|uniref:hypothetical protein n=1 Tax=Acytostelium subglobosum LB1 TaxID=1410327 RepID=UPI000644F2F9
DFKEIILQSKDGITIQCWQFTHSNFQSTTIPTMLFCHGTGGNISHRLENLKTMFKEIGCNIFILSYRGYGKSTGKPSQQGFQYDIDACIEYLIYQDDGRIDPDKIFLFGRSLGGAVAIDTAKRYPKIVKALILENTFLSVPDMIKDYLGDLVVRYLVDPFCKRNSWMSRSSIQSIESPILFLSGRQDSLVPPRHMDELYQRATSSTHKKFIKFDQGSHGNVKKCPHYFDHINEFLQQVFGEDG